MFLQLDRHTYKEYIHLSLLEEAKVYDFSYKKVKLSSK